MVIEEEWFSGVNLTGSANFPPNLIKCEKSIFNQKYKFQVTQSDKFMNVSINYGQNTLSLHIFYEHRYGMIHIKGNLLIILQKPVELSHEWVLTSFKFQEPEFYARLFDESEEDYFEVPKDVTKVGLLIKPVRGAPKLYFSSEAKVLV